MAVACASEATVVRDGADHLRGRHSAAAKSRKKERSRSPLRHPTRQLAPANVLSTAQRASEMSWVIRERGTARIFLPSGYVCSPG